MSKLYICNAFSLSMLDRVDQCSPSTVRVPAPVGPDDLEFILALASDVISAVGHADTAAIFSGILGIAVPVNRMSVKLGPHDSALIGQYVGPRLPEGATSLPEGATIEWWLV